MFDEDDDLDTLRDGLMINNSQSDEEDGTRGIGSGNVLRCPRCRRTRGYRPINVLKDIKGLLCLSCGAELLQCSFCSQFNILPRRGGKAALPCQHCGKPLAC
ncbi:hypothetical protein [Dictyobacter aurantiacus]|uniref:Uncharacterized protein n=1 Tax=Dictyobacter aurantiacus TaxID=1936993 RepID=A0A401ZPX0_9CHLR|nr:hypothetical protein [Dictyobacter aurantiacus]GCE08834.1 hypothetical protein KDAU_61630 [Dictyobacter aurantiacus]